MKKSFIKKPVFLSILLFFTGSSWAANWQKVYDKDGSTVYIDSMTIREDDRLPIVWVITNYHSRSPWGALSGLSHKEFDCKEERYRTLADLAYAEPMGKGRVTSGNASIESLGFVSKWFPVKPGSMNEPVLKIVCAKP